MLAIVATWLLAAQLSHSQTILNFINTDTDRDLSPGGALSPVVLRFRRSDKNGDNSALEYSAFVAQIQTLLGNVFDPPAALANDAFTYRELVAANAGSFLYIPYANRRDRGTYRVTNGFADMPYERGFILRLDDLYFVAARVGNRITVMGKDRASSDGETQATADLLGPALAATHQPAGGWQLVVPGSVGILYGQLPLRLQDLPIKPSCLDKHLEALLQYAFSDSTPGASELEKVEIGVMTVAVAVSEALRMPPVQDRIQAGLDAGDVTHLGFGPNHPTLPNQATIASIMPKKWGAASGFVRSGVATDVNLGSMVYAEVDIPARSANPAVGFAGSPAIAAGQPVEYVSAYTSVIVLKRT